MFNLFGKRLIAKVDKFIIDDIEIASGTTELVWLEKVRHLKFCFKQRNKIAVKPLVVAPCVMGHRPYLKDPDLFLDRLIANSLIPQCVKYFLGEENKFILVEIDNIDLTMLKECDDYYHQLAITELRIYELSAKRFMKMREDSYLSATQLYSN